MPLSQKYLELEVISLNVQMENVKQHMVISGNIYDLYAASVQILESVRGCFSMRKRVLRMGAHCGGEFWRQLTGKRFLWEMPV